MNRFVLSFAVLGFLANPTFACWVGIEPAAFATNCPIIVRGTIVAVEEAAPNQERADDLAVIEITDVLLNHLKDEPLKVGGKITVRMVSRKNRSRVSTDLNYPLKTSATWLIVLNSKGEYRIDVHPVQKQPADTKLRLREVVAIEKTKDGTIRGTITRQEWIKRVDEKQKRAAEAMAVQKAVEEEIRGIAQSLAAAATVDAAAMRRYRAASVDIRRGVFQLRGDSPLKDARLVEVVEYVLKNDPDENVRVFAASCLGLVENLRGGSRAGEVLARALADRSAAVRLFACQALGQRAEKAQAAAVLKLLHDGKQDVRLMAVSTLGRLGDASAVPVILELYERERADPSCAYEFAVALAHLGETKISLRAARQAMQSDNWNVRWFALGALERIESKETIPALMDALVPELQRAVQEGNNKNNDRNYKKLCEVLAKRTGKQLGLDPIAWANWWEAARQDFAAPALNFDPVSLRKTYSDYNKE